MSTLPFRDCPGLDSDLTSSRKHFDVPKPQSRLAGRSRWASVPMLTCRTRHAVTPFGRMLVKQLTPVVIDCCQILHIFMQEVSFSVAVFPPPQASGQPSRWNRHFGILWLSKVYIVCALAKACINRNHEL